MHGIRGTLKRITGNKRRVRERAGGASALLRRDANAIYNADEIAVFDDGRVIGTQQLNAERRVIRNISRILTCATAQNGVPERRRVVVCGVGGLLTNQ